MSSSYHKPTHTFKEGAFNATQVRLYGIHNPMDAEISKESPESGVLTVEIKLKKDGKVIPVRKEGLYLIKIGKNRDNLAFIVAANLEGTKRVRSIGVIYGYAYEGHCYDLPKPAIMLIPVSPTEIPKNDCGYDKKKGHNYMVWVVDKLEACEHVEINSGFVEQLILDANLPGRRSPSTYSATMQLAHRSGRLTD